jgi:hypothetical protein
VVGEQQGQEGADRKAWTFGRRWSGGKVSLYIRRAAGTAMAPKKDGAQSHAAAYQTPAGRALPYGSMDGGAWVVERGAWSEALGRAGGARRIWEAAQRSAAPWARARQGTSRPVEASQGRRVGRGTGGVEPSPPGSRAPTATCATTADESRGETDPCHAPAAPKATRASGRGRMKAPTARAPGPFGQR